jgi:hypothetical protein
VLQFEATWIGKALAALEANAISPLLNLGSATASFRERDQPWIDADIFAPLRKRGVTVQHLDIQEGDGIDIRGDLMDESFVSQLGEGVFGGILCCNVLEHVLNPSALCARLERLVTDGGYLVVTVPYRFPYHPDPIDTMFRPELATLRQLFPHSRFVSGEIINCGTGWDYVGRDPRILVQKIKHRLSGMGNHGGLRGSTSFTPWLFRQFRQSCAVLQRHSAAI